MLAGGGGGGDGGSGADAGGFGASTFGAGTTGAGGSTFGAGMTGVGGFGASTLGAGMTVTGRSTFGGGAKGGDLGAGTELDLIGGIATFGMLKLNDLNRPLFSRPSESTYFSSVSRFLKFGTVRIRREQGDAG